MNILTTMIDTDRVGIMGMDSSQGALSASTVGSSGSYLTHGVPAIQDILASEQPPSVSMSLVEEDLFVRRPLMHCVYKNQYIDEPLECRTHTQVSCRHKELELASAFKRKVVDFLVHSGLQPSGITISAASSGLKLRSTNFSL